MNGISVCVATERPVAVSIVGAGIVGLMTAQMIRELTGVEVDIYDAGGDPTITTSGLTSATFGEGGKDARQVTADESLSWQNAVQVGALYLGPDEETGVAGWRLIPEAELTEHEQAWRNRCMQLFEQVRDEPEGLNTFDVLHAGCNSAGMVAWRRFFLRRPELSDYLTHDGSIRVLLGGQEEFEADLDLEREYLRQFGQGAGEVVVVDSDGDNDKHLRGLVETGGLHPSSIDKPGLAIRVQSLGRALIETLQGQEGVRFHWGQRVTDEPSVPNGNVIIWTAGSSDGALPEFYRRHNVLIQGIAGCWATIPNTGFTKPFKLALPQPMGYVNCTPGQDEDGNSVLHVSGGFGWVGERPYAAAEKLMQPVVEEFRRMMNQYFGVSPNDMAPKGRFPIGVCLRPSSPTGLPDGRVIDEGGVRHVVLTGSGKAGTTQAVLLALLALRALEAIDPGVLDGYLNSLPEAERAITRAGLDALGLLGSLAIQDHGTRADTPAR